MKDKTKKKSRTFERVAARQIRKQFKHSNTIKSQKSMLLSYFDKTKSYINTIEARTWLRLHYPPQVVSDLRQDGHEIKTVMGWAKDSGGVQHCVAHYTLIKKPNNTRGGAHG